MAVSILGDDRGFRNQTDLLPSSTALTFMFWVRCDVAVPTYRDFYLLDADAGSGTGPYWWVGTNGSNLEVYVYRGSTGGELTYILPGYTWVNRWNHIAISVSGAANLIYINTQQGGRIDFVQDAPSGAIAELLGSPPGGNGLFTVSEYRRWTAALTRTEIVREYQSSDPVRTLNLYRDLPLITVDGTDRSGAGHHMDVINGGGMTAVTGRFGSVSASRSPSQSTSLSPSGSGYEGATAETAIVIETLPYSFIDPLEGHVLWFKYTHTADDIMLLVMATETRGTSVSANCLLNVYTGTPSALVPYRTGATGAVHLVVAVGTTYYFRVPRTDGYQADDQVAFHLLGQPQEDVPADAMLITDDQLGEHPTLVSQDGRVLNVLPVEYGDFGAILDSGIFGIGDYAYDPAGITGRTSFLGIYSPTFTKIADWSPAGILENEAIANHIAAHAGSTFYVAWNDYRPYPDILYLTLVSDAGVELATYQPPRSTGTAIVNGAVNDANTVYYYVVGYEQTIRRLQLSDGSALTPFVVDFPDYFAYDCMLALSDGSLVVGTLSHLIYRFDLTGAIIGSCDIGALGMYIDRLAYAADDPTHFWCWAFGPTTWESHFLKIRTSDCAIVFTSGPAYLYFNTRSGPREFLSPWTSTDVPVWGPSESCSLLVLRQPVFPTSGSPSASPSFEIPEIRPIRRVRQSPHLSDEQMWYYVSSFQLDLETGRGLVTGQGMNPQIMLQWSDDGGHTWSEEHWYSAGVQGAYRWRALWRRLGKSRDRVWRVSMSDPVPWRLLDAYVNVEKGTS